MANEKNLGIPYLKIELYDGLKCGTGAISKTKNVNLTIDCDASSWDLLTSGVFPPIFCEQIKDADGNLAAIIPLRRTMMVNNLLIDGTPLPATK